METTIGDAWDRPGTKHGTRTPRVGDDLGGGVDERILLAYRHGADGGVGTYSYGSGLFVWRRGDDTEFVIWTVIWDDDHEEWVMESGEYFLQDLPASVKWWAR